MSCEGAQCFNGDRLKNIVYIESYYYFYCYRYYDYFTSGVCVLKRPDRPAVLRASAALRATPTAQIQTNRYTETA